MKIISNYWGKLSPKTKRLLVIGTTCTSVISLIYLCVRQEDKTPNQLFLDNQQNQIQILSTKKLDEFTIASLSNAIEQNKLEQQRTLQVLKELQQELDKLKRTANSVSETPLRENSNTPTDKYQSVGRESIAQIVQNLIKLSKDPNISEDELRKRFFAELKNLEWEEKCELYYTLVSRSEKFRNKQIEESLLSNRPIDDKDLASSQELNRELNQELNDLQDPLELSQTLPNDRPRKTTLYIDQQLPGDADWQDQVIFDGRPQQVDNYPLTTSVAPQKVNSDLSIKTIASSDSTSPPNNGINIPAGSVFTGTLVTGVDAPTSDGAKQDPYPVLVKLNSLDFLPNNKSSDLQACFVLLSSYGDMSSQRAYMRTQTLSCINNDGYILEGEIKGYVVGHDGKIGIPGRLVSKQGSLIAQSLSIGFMQGISQAFNKTNVLVNSVPGYNFNNLMQEGIVSGANKAIDKIAGFYLNLASKMFPLVEVQANTSVDIILTTGLNLDISSRRFSSYPLGTSISQQVKYISNTSNYSNSLNSSSNSLTPSNSANTSSNDLEVNVVNSGDIPVGDIPIKVEQIPKKTTPVIRRIGGRVGN